MRASASCVVVTLLAWLAPASVAAGQTLPEQAPADIVATVGEFRISLADVDRQALREPASLFGSLSLAQAVYEARRAALEGLVNSRLIALEAERQGIERSVLVQREITAKVGTPTEEEIAAWYKANPARVGDASLREAREAIRDFLAADRARLAEQAFVTRLKARTPVAILLEPPRWTIAENGRPSRGPEQAPVTIVEFSDFQCPFCRGAAPTVRRVLETYGDRVRLVYRHYPLPIHEHAIPAAEASMCAADQGAFWRYHDRLFEQAERLGGRDLKRHAADLGLDTEAFNACVDGRTHRAAVEEDMADGKAAGVASTPTFFINGRALAGARPFESFQRAIEEELARR